MRLVHLLPALFLIAIISLGASQKSVIHAEGNSQTTNADDLEARIKEYEAKINELKGKEKNLTDEIAYLDSTINYTELKIQDAQIKIAEKEAELEKLSKDVENMANNIYLISEALDSQEKVLEERLVARYKSEKTISLELFLNSNGLSDIISRLQYLKIAQEEDNKLLAQLKDTKQNFTSQKVLLEDQKNKVEELKKSIEQEKANAESLKIDLEDQKNSKEILLKITKNDESEYQRLLEEVRREIAQIQGAASALQNYEPKEVSAGDIIGYQGNTGYSYGEHLHFGVYKYPSINDINGWDWYYSNYVSPKEVLEPKNVYWNTGCESPGYRETGQGDWEWPISSPTISQGFGYTCYSNLLYGGKPHPAYDVYGPAGTPIHAAADGKAYFCRNCLGDGANGVFIFHDNEYMTIYWHLR